MLRLSSVPPTSIIMADLDHFKQINDTYGHAAGDDVLSAAVKAIEGSLRPYDLAGRYGGEEFLIVVPNCAAAGAVTVAERVRRMLGETIIEIEGQPLKISGSFGVAVSAPKKMHSADTLIQAADAALYRAKAAGRNCVESATAA